MQQLLWKQCALPLGLANNKHAFSAWAATSFNLLLVVFTVFSEALIGSNENLYTDPAAQDENEEEVEQKGHENDQEKEEEAGEWDEVSSQVSSASSEDYIVILPDCFDTSRPLGESCIAQQCLSLQSLCQRARGTANPEYGRRRKRGAHPCSSSSKQPEPDALHLSDTGHSSSNSRDGTSTHSSFATPISSNPQVKKYSENPQNIF